jgi:hypothetical protein
MERRLTISAQYQPRRWRAHHVPFIRMSGTWLARAGFPIGSKINVRVENGALIIQPS